MGFPLIDIIVPVYNAERYLEQCILSIVHQTYKNIRMIFVNDGSTDASLDILYTYKKIYNNIEIINQENRGVGYARNVALKCIKGSYVAFIDADDYIADNYIMKLWTSISKCDADIAVGSFEEKNKNSLLKDIAVNVLSLEDKEAFFENYVIENKLYYCVTNKMYRVSTLTKSKINFEEDCRFGEDLLFLLKLYTFVNKIVIVKDAVYYYSLSENSITRTPKPSRCYEQFKILILYNCFLKEKSIIEQYKVILSQLLWLFIVSSITLSKREGAATNYIIEFCKYVVSSDVYKYIKKNKMLLKGLLSWTNVECISVKQRIFIRCEAIVIIFKRWQLLKMIIDRGKNES